MKKLNNRPWMGPTITHASRVLVIVATLATMSPASVRGDDKSDVAVNLKAQRVIATRDGHEEFASAEQAAPGETVLYTAVYHNRSTTTIKGLEATLPIPEGMAYVPSSTEPASPKASTDGVVFQSIPLKRKVKSVDGTEHEELVPYAQYRRLRWKVGELAPDASVMVSARATILDQTATAKQ